MTALPRPHDVREDPRASRRTGAGSDNERGAGARADMPGPAIADSDDPRLPALL